MNCVTSCTILIQMPMRPQLRLAHDLLKTCLRNEPA